MDNQGFFRQIVEKWYSDHQRSLPWRSKSPDPYRVWLSEIILQQTRVAQGLPYFEKIVNTYPRVEDLAGASLDSVLALWSGLGYYSRARNLHACAQQVVQQHNGKFPESAAELQKLKGIGPYTSAAIASICFKEPVAVVDGNVYRVLSRYFGIDTPINSTEGVKLFQSLAQSCLEGTPKPGDYNQAIMEFGAMQCTPKKTNCTTCPLHDRCLAYATQKVQELPVKLKKLKRTQEHIHYAVHTKDNMIALVQRDASSIWPGLYELGRFKKAPNDRTEAAPMVLHKLSHKDLYCHFWSGPAPHQLEEPLQWYGKNDALQLGLPAVIRDFILAHL